MYVDRDFSSVVLSTVLTEFNNLHAVKQSWMKPVLNVLYAEQLDAIFKLVHII